MAEAPCLVHLVGARAGNQQGCGLITFRAGAAGRVLIPVFLDDPVTDPVERYKLKIAKPISVMAQLGRSDHGVIHLHQL
jgi:hypothetical protein